MSHYCANCGTFCEDGKVYCPNCGAQQPNAAQAPAQQSYQQSYQQPYGQQPYHQTPGYAANQNYGISNEMPMKWFKFIIYFQLFANCVLNVISAITTFTGSQYQGAADMIYTYVDGLQTVDTLYGVLLLAVAAFAIFVRFRLAKFCSNGPTMYYALLVAQLVISVIYLIGVNTVVGNSIIANYYEPDYTSVVSSLVTTGIMLACNIVYFKKRMHLFVND